VSSEVNGVGLDAAIGYHWSQNWSGDSVSNGFAIAGFQHQYHPTKPNSFFLEGVSLPWNDGSTTDFNHSETFLSRYLALPIRDSITFDYQGFDGENFSAAMTSTGSLGQLTAPDPVIASKGFQISWKHIMSTDTVTVRITYEDSTLTNIFDTVARFRDVGHFDVPPIKIDRAGGYATYDVTRDHVSLITSPNGKKIAVFSEVGIEAYGSSLVR
jgi:hypothetical protein